MGFTVVFNMHIYIQELLNGIVNQKILFTYDHLKQTIDFCVCQKTHTEITLIYFLTAYL